MDFLLIVRHTILSFLKKEKFTFSVNSGKRTLLQHLSLLSKQLRLNF